MRDVDVICPNGSLDAVLAQHGLSADRNTVRVLGFPKHLFEFDIEINRRIFESRDVSMSVTVDLLTATCRKNDVYPEIESRSVSATSLLNPRLDQETAADTAYSFVRRKINRQYNSFSTPHIQILRDETAFKLFWIVPVSSSENVHVIDTITHQLTAQDVALDSVTEESTAESLDR
ncbi:hypothetical protein Htur_4842 (plasmid) [Haloterrigena turkmenica DSM 5511]|uniref:Uncharacterized protein n=1 Tax=Haloterrigena turkmenica (strain ATCC 51198 / DSM 5511 / JCM 9101 / NCIMB 13204 / VKM B-1734 / 4k) TaxID=543526 RepID=D2S2K5_HALTV|nr:hypothetical protein [Haloterrigena turkmenica]ADB63602.1 hypothetical protein Htur_4842 [Haloterrigena turkmenica DSM 5511]